MFTGHENHNIPLQDAAALTARYRTVLMPILGGTKAEFFGRDAIESVLAQDGVVGIRIYLGLSADIIPLPRLVLVGVNAAGNDITTGVILEHGGLCPPNCPTINNPLNS